MAVSSREKHSAGLASVPWLGQPAVERIFAGVNKARQGIPGSICENLGWIQRHICWSEECAVPGVTHLRLVYEPRGGPSLRQHKRMLARMIGDVAVEGA